MSLMLDVSSIDFTLVCCLNDVYELDTHLFAATTIFRRSRRVYQVLNEAPEHSSIC